MPLDTQKDRKKEMGPKAVMFIYVVKCGGHAATPVEKVRSFSADCIRNMPYRCIRVYT